MSPVATSTPTPSATPGVDRVIKFDVNGHTFAFRRPSRADVSEAWRALVRKLALAGDSKTMDAFDGKKQLWEARLEVGLRPRWRNGAEVNLGETAPAHWLMPLMQGGTAIAQVVDFAEVDPDEFDAVADYLEALVYTKAPPVETRPTSIGSAVNPGND